MTKSELIARLAERYPQLVAKDADFTVKTLLDAMTDALISGLCDQQPSATHRAQPEVWRDGGGAGQTGTALQGGQGVA